MSKFLSSLLCASAVLLAGGAGLTAVITPAVAQASLRLGFDFFHARLSNQGRWLRHPVWGDVWRPRLRMLGPDWQPYMNGYWQYTDEYGWYWVSDDPIDDVVYHYGRWVYDPDYQWLWVPGYTWAPAWVVWREGDDYTGWAPLPPDEAFVSGSGLSFGVNLGPVAIDFYDRWYGGRVDPARFFVFVDNRHIVDRNFRRFVVPRERVKVVLGRTREVTKFEVANGRVVNRGIDLRLIERATGRRIAPVSAKAVIKPNAIITTVDESKQIRQRERAAHPIDVEAVRRGRRAGDGEKPAADATGKDAGSAQESGRDGSRNGDGRRNAGERSTIDSGAQMPDGGKKTEGRDRDQNKDRRMSTPAGEEMPGAGNERGGRSRDRDSTGRMTNPSGEDMDGGGQTSRKEHGGGTTARPEAGAGMNGPDQKPEGAKDDNPGASAAGGPRHRPRNIGGGSSAGGEQGSGETTRSTGGDMNGSSDRRRPGGGSAASSEPPRAGAAPGDGNGPAQARKRKSSSSEAAPDDQQKPKRKKDQASDNPG